MSNAKDQPTKQTIKATLAALTQAGWLPAGEGSISVRGTEQGDLLGARVSPLVGEESFEVTELTAEGPSAAVLHRRVYEAVEAQAILHLFPLEALLCGDRDTSRGFTHLHGIALAAHLGAEGDDLAVDLPVIEVEGGDVGQALADYFGGDDRSELPLLNLKNRGLLVWGNDLTQALQRAEALALLYRYSWGRPMNPPKKAATAGFGL